MPIKSLSAIPSPGHMIQVCAACGAEHTISFDRGAQKAKTGPTALQVGDTLTLRVDAGPPISVTFASGDFPDFARVTAAQLTAKINAEIPGARASDDGGGLLLESRTHGEGSRLEVVDGTARIALGFAVDTRRDPCVSRPLLGVSAGADHRDPNVIVLRRCNDCGANECLVRTFDSSPAHVHGTHFAEHRKVVNPLAEHCKAQGWSHPDVADQHAAEATQPADLHRGFPRESVVTSQLVQRNSQHAVGEPETAR